MLKNCIAGKINGTRTLIAVPVFNEQRYVTDVLSKVAEFAKDILVIDDGSTDYTPMLLALQPVDVIRHATNRGYGHSLQDAFRWAQVDRYDWLITMDCDEQHEPESIPDFLKAIEEDEFDVISGSRYLKSHPLDDRPPTERREINHVITEELNGRLGLALTDAFCGFKAYRVSALDKLSLAVDGYDFPMQFWVQAVANDLRISELPIRLIYNDPQRTFGGPLDDRIARMDHYRKTLYAEVLKCRYRLPESAWHDLVDPAEIKTSTAGCDALSSRVCGCPTSS
ncbi:MAG: glycosyltransferase family 2 protein [Planctomycetes bacterium]|nr:glycosyltransferase family 2 protein [Planctomycetota bacterium]NOG53826.1 glycosyltransferase family 2 protein [Planctomycetota bacterium]